MRASLKTKLKIVIVACDSGNLPCMHLSNIYEYIGAMKDNQSFGVVSEFKCATCEKTKTYQSSAKTWWCILELRFERISEMESLKCSTHLTKLNAAAKPSTCNKKTLNTVSKGVRWRTWRSPQDP